jgi:hypothetical protein
MHTARRDPTDRQTPCTRGRVETQKPPQLRAGSGSGFKWGPLWGWAGPARGFLSNGLRVQLPAPP